MNKQIEEMAKVLLEASCKGSECENCAFVKTVKEAEECCVCLKALYNAGYRKIPENAVVLTREEYQSVKDNIDLLREYESVSNSLIKSNELCRKLVEDKKELKRQLEQTRKETAEKLLDKIDYQSNGTTKQITDLLRKEFVVEKND